MSPSSEVSQLPACATSQRARKIRLNPVDGLYHAVARVEELFGDIPAIHVAGAETFATGEEGSQRGRRVANAAVVAGPVHLAAVVVIPELPGGFRIAADAESQLQERRLRYCQRGQVDDAATEFTGEVRRERLLHQRRGNDVRGKQIERHSATQWLGTRQRQSIQQCLRVAVAETAYIDETAAGHAQASHSGERAGDVAITSTLQVFRRQNRNHFGGSALHVAVTAGRDHDAGQFDVHGLFHVELDAAVVRSGFRRFRRPDQRVGASQGGCEQQHAAGKWLGHVRSPDACVSVQRRQRRAGHAGGVRAEAGGG